MTVSQIKSKLAWSGKLAVIKSKTAKSIAFAVTAFGWGKALRVPAQTTPAAGAGRGRGYQKTLLQHGTPQGVPG